MTHSAAKIRADATYSADIVIAGGGLSGLSAALTAAELGVKAIVLEKMHFLGGAGLYPEGSLGIGTRFQKENGIYTTVAEVFARAMEFHHWRCNASVIRALLDESGKTIDWLMDHGIEIKGIRTMFPPEKSLQVWHLFKGSGARVVRMMTEGIKRRGGLILTKTPVCALMIDDTGAVTGAMARDDRGRCLALAAKAVILATGGFVNNKAMLKTYVPEVSTPGMEKLMVRGPAVDGRTGDGIRLALTANAALAGMQTIAGNSPYLDHEPAIRQFRGPDHLKQARCALSQPFLWVNRHGRRFYNESLGSVFSDVYNAMTANGGLMWSIFDDAMRRSMIDHGPLTPFNAIVVPGQTMTALDDGIRKGIESGFAFKARTIEALAEKIQVRPGTLRRTIEALNRYADQGHDPEFNRRPEHLVKFNTEEGPYFALKGLRAFFLTLGGVTINAAMQALDDNGEVIAGLYATGQDMGGLYDSTYDLLLEGSASSFALSSGRIAANHIIHGASA